MALEHAITRILHDSILYYAQEAPRCAQIFRIAPFLPLPATQEWGEDRGEGHPTSLLTPTLSSIGWRRGSFFGSGCDGLRTLCPKPRTALKATPLQPFAATLQRFNVSTSERSFRINPR